MKRKEFLAYLVRAVKDKFLTEQQASALLRKFDAGEIDESMLPLDEVIPTTEGDIQKGILALAVLGVVANGVFKRLTERQQESVATKLQERFAKEARAIAPTALKNLSNWQRAMGLSVQEHIIQQSLLGRLRPLAAEEIKILDNVIRTQQAYLSRFADEQASRLMMGNPFSVDYIGARSEQYNGEARAEFYRAKEGEAEDGTVFDYISVDDDGTCQPCLDAESASPYLPGQGEFPGPTCDGRGFCRCTREERFSPTEAAELLGSLRAA